MTNAPLLPEGGGLPPGPPPSPQWRERVRRAVSATPDLMMAWTFLLAWVAPHRFGVDRIPDLLTIMLLEFFVIHATPFLLTFLPSPPLMSIKQLGSCGPLLGVSLFYTAFVGCFSLTLGSPWMLVAFWGLMLNRMLGRLLAPPDEAEPSPIAGKWGLSVILFIASVAVTAFLPMPRLGISADVIEVLSAGGATGLWIERPQHLLAAGVLYFASQGTATLLEADKRLVKGAEEG